MADAVGHLRHAVVDDLLHQLCGQEGIQDYLALLAESLDKWLQSVEAHFESCQAVDVVDLREHLVH